MIIGGNNNPLDQNNNFSNNYKRLQEENERNHQKKNLFTQSLSTQTHTNPVNNNDMYDKSLAMLHERLENNLITLEEFNKKCALLGQKRQNSEKKNNLF